MALLGGAAWSRRGRGPGGRGGDRRRSGGARRDRGDRPTAGAESLMSVPVAVSALSGESMLKQGVTRPTALASLVPNLQVNDSTGGAEPEFHLAGRRSRQRLFVEPASPVGVYIDDAYLAFRATHGARKCSTWSAWRCCAVPQGTLFGRNPY
ncbi:TonB-dependent receptor plug domain-containing protein [Caulobacter segnis]